MATGKEALIQACIALKLRHETDFTINLGNDDRLMCDVLIHHLGGPEGMLIFSDSSGPSKHGDRLVELGFGYTSWNLDTEDQAPSDTIRFIEMFSDFGWTGPDDQRPPWFVADEEEISDVFSSRSERADFAAFDRIVARKGEPPSGDDIP